MKMIDDNMVQVLLRREENYYIAQISFTDKDINTNDFEYAFYFMLDNIRIETKYYSKENCACFSPVCEGKYHVVGFVKQGEKKIIKRSEYLYFKFDDNFDINGKASKVIPVSIFGSCVSRDIFNFDRKNFFSVKTYVARQSIISAVSESIPCQIENINLKSKFQREAVYNDFIKETFARYKKDKSDYFIIDLIDERFKLSRYNNERKSFITYSSCLDESKYVTELNFVPRKKKLTPWKEYFIDDKNLCEYMDLFCDEILSIFSSDRIILNKGKMLHFYKNKQGDIKKFSSIQVKWNKEVNDLVDYMYDYLEGKFENCSVIDFCEEYCADEEHRWGLAPMHYEKDYYERALTEMVKIVNGGGALSLIIPDVVLQFEKWRVNIA